MNCVSNIIYYFWGQTGTWISDTKINSKHCFVWRLTNTRMKLTIFYIWISLEASDHFLSLLFLRQADKIFSICRFALSTEPWLWLWRSFPWTIFASGYNIASFPTNSPFLNSPPLSECKIQGAPKTGKMSDDKQLHQMFLFLALSVLQILLGDLGRP